MTSTVRLEARSQVFQHVATLLTASRHDAQRPLHEPAPSALSVPPLIRRQITANRNARSAALFVGSIPSTRANVQNPSSTLRISKHVADVFAHGALRPFQRALLDLTAQAGHLLETPPNPESRRGPGASRGTADATIATTDRRSRLPSPPRSIIAWKSRRRWAQQICRHRAMIHAYALNRSLPTTCSVLASQQGPGDIAAAGRRW